MSRRSIILRASCCACALGACAPATAFEGAALTDRPVALRLDAAPLEVVPSNALQGSDARID